MPKTAFLIAGLSGRALAAAAHRAGHRVNVVDLYDDEDLRTLARKSLKVKGDGGGGLDADSLIEAAGRLAPAEASGECPFVYGAGFEDRPELLEKLARGRRLYGNSPATVVRLKDPEHFFPLLGRLGFLHPEVRLTPPGDPKGWLVKRVGGSGGTHIHPLRKEETPQGRVYFQRRVAGRSLSAVFLADGKHAGVLGFSEQWCSPGLPSSPGTTPSQSPSAALASAPQAVPSPACSPRPYRFGGAVAPITVAPGLRDELVRTAGSLAGAYGLVGLNSLDVLVPEDKEARPAFHIIEVNPRSGATLDLFDRRPGASLFDLHVSSVAGEPPPPVEEGWLPGDRAFACAILYAKDDFTMAGGFAWPAWTADRPRSGSFIPADGPLCTVFGEGGNAHEARTSVLDRSRALRRSLGRSKGASSA